MIKSNIVAYYNILTVDAPPALESPAAFEGVLLDANFGGASFRFIGDSQAATGFLHTSQRPVIVSTSHFGHKKIL